MFLLHGVSTERVALAAALAFGLAGGGAAVRALTAPLPGSSAAPPGVVVPVSPPASLGGKVDSLTTAILDSKVLGLPEGTRVVGTGEPTEAHDRADDPAPRITVLGLVVGRGRLALVDANGAGPRVVVEGDTVAGWTVQRITPDSLQVADRKRTWTYPLHRAWAP
jgi:hypothetical protein